MSHAILGADAAEPHHEIPAARFPAADIFCCAGISLLALWRRGQSALDVQRRQPPARGWSVSESPGVNARHGDLDYSGAGGLDSLCADREWPLFRDDAGAR